MAQFNISDELYEALGSKQVPNERRSHVSDRGFGKGKERVIDRSRDLTPCRNGWGSIKNIPHDARMRRERSADTRPRPSHISVRGHHKSYGNSRDERSLLRFERDPSDGRRTPLQGECSGRGKFYKGIELDKREIPEFMYSNLKALMKKSPNEVVTYLSSKKDGFTSLLALDLRPDMIMLLVEILARSSTTTLKENHAAVLAVSVKPNVLEMFSSHSFNITAQNMRYSNLEILNYFGNLAIFYQDAIDIIPSTAAEHLQEYVTKAFMGLTTVKVMKNVPLTEDLESKYNNLMASVKSLIELKQSSTGGKFKKKEKQEWQPGINFRELSIFPLPKDVLCRSEVQLSPLVKCGPYKSVEHYLDVHFNLMREDFLIPLREGISNFISRSSQNKVEKYKRIENIRFYRNVKFVTYCIDGESFIYEICFDPKKRLSRVNWKRSKRFLYGALLCFTNDSFNSLFLGVVKNRDIGLLEKGLLRVELIGPSNKLELFQAEYTVAESEIYFEAYQHVMKALQNFKEETFPMKEYIINVSSESKLPNYLATNPYIEYTFKGIRFPVIIREDWPEEIKCQVNESQLRAIHSALTKKCAVIQGPPGTGKTYIGLIIAGILLENKAHWRTMDRRGPILVVCFTNHALDQFLEGLLTYTSKIIRVGNQSKNEKLNEYNLRCHRRIGPIFHHALSHIEDELHCCLRDLVELHNREKEYSNKIGIIKLDFLNKYMIREHSLWFTDKYQLNDSLLVEWLLSGSSFQDKGSVQFEINDVECVKEQEMYACDLFEYWNHIQNLQTELLAAEGNEYDYIMWFLTEFRSRFVYLKSRLRMVVEKNEDMIRQLIAVHNLNQLSHSQRWVLYHYWVSEAIKDCEDEIHQKRLLYRNLMKRKLEIRESLNLEEILNCDVVGMTTTGAARHQELLQKLGSKIVIVEEAAEALESHVISSLSARCEHLILIGDHKQLRPAPAVYRLAKNYNLEISLFERMLLNKVDYDTLLIQHRMRPEIAELIVPAIYPTLENHPSVLYGDVMGLQRNFYFIHHTSKEEMALDDTSKKNRHEAEFLIALCRHMVLQGYDPCHITLLTTYTGQMFLLMEEKEKHSLISGVKITVVDNYQGEENDIVLLSLVRNNEDKKIGFVASEHRTCVALSRAKKGLYIMGNIDMLSENNLLWSKIHNVLKEKGAIGSHLTLKCMRHPDQLTDVNKAEDFVSVTEGGCRKMCSDRLSCGHKCKKMCHARSHEGFKCFEVCNRVMCILNHLCQKPCWMECGYCMVKVDASLPCGHKAAIPCHIDPLEYKCKELVEVTLPDCEHTILKECGLPTKSVRCSFDCDTRLPCGHKCLKRCHMKEDPNHMDYKCMKPCERNYRGCKEEHKCQKLCHEECTLCEFKVNRKLPNCSHFYKMRCSDDAADQKCSKPCKKKLECGHHCPMKCYEQCGNCPVLVDKEIPECKHIMKMKCCKIPSREMCLKECERTRSCGHPCGNVCGKPCDEEDCHALSSKSAKASCGHDVRLFCSEGSIAPRAEVLMKRCREPCQEILECTHRCKGSCILCMQGRVHIPCEQKCGKTLICGHECIVSCAASCPPCRKKCFIYCKHSKCKDNCGVPCPPCKEKCEWKCEHFECHKKCSELCDRPPCNEPCREMLKCGHPCIGFCGEECPPLCRICHAEEVDDIIAFLGSDDCENARFVVLPKCGHVLEVTGLDKWLEMESDSVKLKLCPRCSTPIQGAYRYGNILKQHFFNVLKVKGTIFGSVKAINKSVSEAIKKLEPKFIVAQELKIKRSTSLGFLRLVTHPENPVFEENAEGFMELRRLTHGKKVKRDAFFLNSLEVRTGFIERIADLYDKMKGKVDDPLRKKCTEAANTLIKVFLRRLNSISEQEQRDFEGLCMRFHLIMELRALESTEGFKNFTRTDWYVKYLDCKSLIDGFSRLGTTEHEDLVNKIKDLYRVLTSGHIGISSYEMKSVVNALCLRQGHWKICPNGHLYVIANCGGAVEESNCNECGERIGGTDHRLLPSNRTLQNVPVGI